MQVSSIIYKVDKRCCSLPDLAITHREMLGLAVLHYVMNTHGHNLQIAQYVSRIKRLWMLQTMLEFKTNSVSLHTVKRFDRVLVTPDRFE